MLKIDCTKCSGTGHISAFNHVAGGICFTCSGRGYKLQKNPPRVSKKFTVGAIHKASNEFLNPIFTLKARSKKEAENRVRKQLANSGYFADTAVITEV